MNADRVSPEHETDAHREDASRQTVDLPIGACLVGNSGFEDCDVLVEHVSLSHIVVAGKKSGDSVLLSWQNFKEVRFSFPGAGGGDLRRFLQDGMIVRLEDDYGSVVGVVQNRTARELFIATSATEPLKVINTTRIRRFSIIPSVANNRGKATLLRPGYLLPGLEQFRWGHRPRSLALMTGSIVFAGVAGFSSQRARAARKTRSAPFSMGGFLAIASRSERRDFNRYKSINNAALSALTLFYVANGLDLALRGYGHFGTSGKLGAEAAITLRF